MWYLLCETFKSDQIEEFKEWYLKHKTTLCIECARYTIDRYRRFLLCVRYYSSRGYLNLLKVIYEDCKDHIPMIMVYAAKHGRLDIVRYFYFTINHLYIDEAFGYALRHNQMEIVKYFLSQGYLITINSFRIPNLGTCNNYNFTLSKSNKYPRKLSKTQMTLDSFKFCMDNISPEFRTQRWKIIDRYSTRFICKIYRKFSYMDLLKIHNNARFEVSKDRDFLAAYLNNKIKPNLV